MKLIIGITGASGPHYGIRLLEVLHEKDDIETHLVISETAEQTIAMESDKSLQEVRALADVVYEAQDLSSALSSGSFRTDGMIIAPCSIKTLSGIANSFNVNLVIRAADVVLKEKRKLILLVRETPLHGGHLRLMTQASEAGAIIMPPVPAFYHHPTSLQDIIDHTVGKVLDLLNIKHDLFKRWG
ncbi:MAG: UbiX family flavin prenyltransferase [Deltaproteobacteria bacterium]|nr:UbiX family flavin prenyltransferase [Deltaproteobacteria bacterium]